MGLLGFISNIAIATVKTALSPVAVVLDVADILTGEEPEQTMSLMDNIGDDLQTAIDEIY